MSARTSVYGQNMSQSTILTVNRCPADTITCIASGNPGTPPPAARCTRLRVNLRPTDAYPHPDPHTSSHRTSCHRRTTHHSSCPCRGTRTCAHAHPPLAVGRGTVITFFKTIRLRGDRSLMFFRGCLLRKLGCCSLGFRL